MRRDSTQPTLARVMHDRRLRQRDALKRGVTPVKRGIEQKTRGEILIQRQEVDEWRDIVWRGEPGFL